MANAYGSVPFNLLPLPWLGPIDRAIAFVHATSPEQIKNPAEQVGLNGYFEPWPFRVTSDAMG